jgi:diguanylate cyclase (GGDEF)-like protein/PAS domain S-box-containing protein
MMLYAGIVVATLTLALYLQRRHYSSALRRYRKLFDRSVAGLYRARIDGTFLEVNEELANLCGPGEEALVGRSMREFFANPAEFDEVLRAVRSDGSAPKQVHRIRRSDGAILFVACNAFLLPGDPPEIEGSVVDVTGLHEAEERVSLLANAVESSRDLISVTDLDDRFTFVNHAFLAEYGYTEGDVIGQHVSLVDSPRNDPAIRRAIFEGTRRGAWSGELLNRRKDGSDFPIALSTSQIRTPEGEFLGLIGVATNITEKKENEERIQYEAYHDVLTALPNRRLFTDRLTVALAHAQRQAGVLAVMFIDLDRFKRINDTLGHPAGDQILCDVSARLRTALRGGDTIARVGGDEFMLLAPGLHDARDAEGVATKILQSIRQPFTVGAHELVVTASIGIALQPADGSEAETLIKNADLAMYRAKDLGRNRYEFSSPATRTEIALQRLNLENGLRRAVQRAELLPYFQPQVRLSTGEIVGAEVLLRWQHPERGLVEASEFIHVAEESNLIAEMGERMLESAVTKLERWQSNGLRRLRIGVNISAQQFFDGDLIALLRGAVSRSGIDPRLLELEITETLAMRDVDETVRILRELKRVGFRVAIDDFGTGHSSLNYLKQFPVDTVKIDRSFIADLTVDPHDAEITSSIIGMAHRLGLNTIAEGVETLEQQAILLTYGCDEMQGFLLHRPMPAHEFEATLELQAAG